MSPLPERFAYYERLSSRERAVYRQSDGISFLRLPRLEELRPLVPGLAEALAADDRRAVAAAAVRLARGLTQALGVPPVELRLRAVRPASRGGELHGLYTVEHRGPPRIELWMRTARHRRVVAFRTFLRTLLHELCHHFDYAYLRLPDSYHTAGFFRRESSLLRQLVP